MSREDHFSGDVFFPHYDKSSFTWGSEPASGPDGGRIAVEAATTATEQDASEADSPELDPIAQGSSFYPGDSGVHPDPLEGLIETSEPVPGHILYKGDTFGPAPQ